MIMPVPALPTNRTTQLVWAVVALCATLALTMAAIAIFNPHDTSTGTILIGIFGPAITALLAIILQSVHVLVNSNTDKLKEAITQLEEALRIANETIAVANETIATLRAAALLSSPPLVPKPAA